ncbi:MAG: hypothetical protein ACREIA_17675 [Opitutaceae bacterium]
MQPASVYRASRPFLKDLFFPTRIKAGLYINRETQDNHTPGRSWTFLGPDGIANNADNVVGNYDFIAEEFSSEDLPFGFPRARVLSPYKILDYYLEHPGQFRLNEVAAIQSQAANSTQVIEQLPQPMCVETSNCSITASSWLEVSGSSARRTRALACSMI